MSNYGVQSQSSSSSSSSNSHSQSSSSSQSSFPWPSSPYPSQSKDKQIENIRQCIATRILSQISKYFNPKYANIPEYVEFCQHVLNVCPQGKQVLVEFMRINSPPASTNTLVRIVQNIQVHDTGVYTLGEYDLKYFVPTQHFDDYANVFKKYSNMSSVELDVNKNLGILREKILAATTLKEAIDILDTEAPSICRYTDKVVKSGTKVYSRLLAREILGKINLEGIEYDILNILTSIPELKIEIVIPARVNSFFSLVKSGSISALPRGTCIPIEDLFLVYKNWITDVGINPIPDDDIQYFLEYTTFPNVYCP